MLSDRRGALAMFIAVLVTACSTQTSGGSSGSQPDSGASFGGSAAREATNTNTEPVPVAIPTIGGVVGSGSPGTTTPAPSPITIGSTVPATAVSTGSVAPTTTPLEPIPTRPVAIGSTSTSSTVTTTTTTTSTTSTTTTTGTTITTVNVATLSMSGTTPVPPTYCEVQGVLTSVLGANGSGGMVINPSALQAALESTGVFGSTTVSSLVNTVGNGPYCQHLGQAVANLTSAQTYTLWNLLSTNQGQLYTSPNACSDNTTAQTYPLVPCQACGTEASQPNLPALPLSITLLGNEPGAAPYVVY